MNKLLVVIIFVIFSCSFSAFSQRDYVSITDLTTATTTMKGIPESFSDAISMATVYNEPMSTKPSVLLSINIAGKTVFIETLVSSWDFGGKSVWSAFYVEGSGTKKKVPLSPEMKNFLDTNYSYLK